MAKKEKQKLKGKDLQNLKKAEHIDPAVISRIAEELKSYNLTVGNGEMRKAKDKFMDLYQKSEFAYKQLLIDYRIIVDGFESVAGCKPEKGERKFNPDNLRIVKGQYQKVFVYAGIPLDEMLFSLEDKHLIRGNKSCRCLRNEITHRNSSNAIKEVYERRDELYAVMTAFLDRFK